jgi:sulfate permease, SulP family
MPLTTLLSTGLRDARRAGYGRAELGRDLLAGMVVAVIALPLSMALAIASGVPPQHGLYTAIVAGALIALFGGSRFQVAGPTAAFVVILVPVSAQYGLGGLLIATLFAGAILVTMGLMRLGRAIQFIPAPVTTGFTAGIAVVIATLQVKDFLGVDAKTEEHFLETASSLLHALPTAKSPELWIGLLTLAILVFFPRITRRVPAALVALTFAAVAAAALSHAVPGFKVATIEDRFTFDAGGAIGHGIPRTPPMPLLPWNLPGPDGRPLVFTVGLLEDLAMKGFTIAMLGAIESLLSAVIADGMGGTRHDPDGELVAQGIGNLAAPFFGGFAATGALARTAANIRAGARSPLSSFFHAVFVLAAVVGLAPLLGHLPMASLAALLLVVAWNMSEWRHFVHTVRVAPRSDVAVLLTCFALTVLFNMVIAVGVGMGLAALLFIRRMSEVGESKILTEHHHALDQKLPKGVIVYEVAGPLFFGAAQRMTRALHTIAEDVKVVVLDISEVPVLDATGLVNLESAIERLHHRRVFVIVAGAREQPMRVLVRAGWRDRRDHIAVRRDLRKAIDEACERVHGAPLPGATPPATPAPI